MTYQFSIKIIEMIEFENIVIQTFAFTQLTIFP